jgi:hypothetical protein
MTAWPEHVKRAEIKIRGSVRIECMITGHFVSTSSKQTNFPPLSSVRTSQRRFHCPWLSTYLVKLFLPIPMLRNPAEPVESPSQKGHANWQLRHRFPESRALKLYAGKSFLIEPELLRRRTHLRQGKNLPLDRTPLWLRLANSGQDV